jgi:hypothetical protein
MVRRIRENEREEGGRGFLNVPGLDCPREGRTKPKRNGCRLAIPVIRTVWKLHTAVITDPKGETSKGITTWKGQDGCSRKEWYPVSCFDWYPE